jgi:hypothetical protein
MQSILEKEKMDLRKKNCAKLLSKIMPSDRVFLVP